jgi:hypothetical protein
MPAAVEEPRAVGQEPIVHVLHVLARKQKYHHDHNAKDKMESFHCFGGLTVKY